MTLTNVVFFPIIHLIIEYLDIYNNCICNIINNDILSLTLVNKEIYKYIIYYNLLRPTRILYYTINDAFVKDFIKMEHICVKHHLVNDTTYLKDIINMLKNCNTNKEESINSDRFMPSLDLADFIKRNHQQNKRQKNKKKIIDYIHCKNIDGCKEFLNNYCQNICVRYSCCSGKGFSIDIYINND